MLNVESPTTSTAVMQAASEGGSATAEKIAKKSTAKKKADGEKKPKAGDSKKITLLAKECPVRKGTGRAKLWGKLKTGMTVGEAREAGIPSRFLKKMKAAEHLKIAA